LLRPWAVSTQKVRPVVFRETGCDVVGALVASMCDEIEQSVVLVEALMAHYT
jgi:hypothetical protein